MAKMKAMRPSDEILLLAALSFNSTYHSVCLEVHASSIHVSIIPFSSSVIYANPSKLGLYIMGFSPD